MDFESLSFQSDITNELNRLDFQRSRIISYQNKTEFDPSKPNMINHDADFYMVLLRRLYRQIEKTSRHDPKVANLKGKYKHLYKKIKIRDHFEHDFDINDLPYYSPSIKIMCGVVINETNPHITSGDQIWTLNDDHNSFKSLVEKYSKLYPFKKSQEMKKSFFKKILIRICKKLKR